MKVVNDIQKQVSKNVFSQWFLRMHNAQYKAALQIHISQNWTELKSVTPFSIYNQSFLD